MLSESQANSSTGSFNRSALLAALFRETDRVQRSKDFLSLVLFEVDNLERQTALLVPAPHDLLVQTLVERVSRLLRSYDSFGRTGEREFLLILPGCSANNANLLAERLRSEVFSRPIDIESQTFRLSACFGIASSEGRSPIVVLRESELALQNAQDAGHESIRTFANNPATEIEPIAFLS